MPRHRPRKEETIPIDDDPFWDSWGVDEPPVVVESKCRPTKKTTTKKIAATATASASASDPFGRDGFGDSWNKPMITFSSDSDEEYMLPLDDTIDTADWGKRRVAAVDRQKAVEEAKRREEFLRKERAAAADFMARKSKKKAELEAAEAKKKAAASAAWDRKVEQAKECIAHADPAQALTILYSLSLDNEIAEYIDTKEKKEVCQMYAALHNHYDIQNTLTLIKLDGSSCDESTSTIGGGTVKLNRRNSDSTSEEEGVSLETDGEIETGSTIVVVDRFPTRLKRDTDRSSCSSESTIGSDTVKHLSSNYQSSNDDEKENEVIGTKSVSVGHGCFDSQTTTTETETDHAARTMNRPEIRTYASDGNKRNM